jgi:hypothetical protein
MTTKIGVALAVALAVCVAPSAMAHSRTQHAHAHHATHPYGGAYLYGGGYEWSPGPGYGATLPPYTPYRYRGWDCVTDEGQGRFLPCDMGGS